MALTGIWNLVGTDAQNALVERAISRCDMDFTKLLPGLAREGKTSLRVEWADLSRYNHTADAHDHAEGAHTISREVDGRMRVLGLFYLPPYMKVVLDNGLEARSELAQEVFLAEAAHAVDYAFMDADDRRAFVNLVHAQQLPPGAPVHDGASFFLDGHTCSWFDVGAYADWVGEAFMEGFIEGTSDIRCTINLNHPVGPEDRQYIRDFLEIDDPPLQPEPEPESGVYRGKPKSKVVHDEHAGIDPTEWFATLAEAQAAGLRACKVCRPT